MSKLTCYVPKHLPATDIDVSSLKNFIERSKKIFILTGAGISTESGIPDYRSKDVGLEARKNYVPVQYRLFVNCIEVRKKYWLRSFVEWPRISQIEPNVVHYAIRDLETIFNKVSAIATQNTDRLHVKAGSKNVIELHGHGHGVMCLKCDNKIKRQEFQETLLELNSDFENTSKFILSDGDIEFTDEQRDSFVIPDCSKCGGILKPEIVFFGEDVSSNNSILASNYLKESDALLVLGSSLTVSTGYNICLEASVLNKPIAIVNIDKTEGDDLAEIKISARCGDVLPKAIEF